MQVQIKFKTFGATSAGGSFGPGDLLRCSPELAKHLVEEAMCAVYVEAPAKASGDAIESAKPVVRGRGGKARE